MRKLLILLTLLLTLAVPSLAAAPVAMITDLRGDVKLDPAGSAPARRADVLTQLSAGDVLDVGPQASCTVTFYSDGHREMVKGGSRVEVAASALSGSGVEKLAASSALASMKPRAPAGAARAAVTTRAPGESVAAVPGLVRVASSNPAFRLPEETVTAELQEASGTVIVAETLMGEAVWVVPLRDPGTRQALPPLKPGVDYRVVSRGAGGEILAARTFQVVAAGPSEKAWLDELDSLASSAPRDPTPWIARAGLLEDAGLDELALDAVLEALARNPSPSLLRWAGDLCMRMDRPAEARAWRALAGPED